MPMPTTIATATAHGTTSAAAMIQPCSRNARGSIGSERSAASNASKRAAGSRRASATANLTVQATGYRFNAESRLPTT